VNNIAARHIHCSKIVVDFGVGVGGKYLIPNQNAYEMGVIPYMY
jgi:hypothetical protein